MSSLIWIVAIAAGSTFFLESAFPIVYGARQDLEDGIKFPSPELLWLARLWFVIGALSDPVYNVIVGRLQFLELPQRGLMFTHRIQWHVDHGSGWRRRRAITWGRYINRRAPNHIKRLPRVE